MTLSPAPPSSLPPYRTLQTTTFTRYKARVRPANLTLEEATGLQEATAAEGSAAELQDWLREGGGSWQGATVAALEGEVVEEFVVVSSTSGERSQKTGPPLEMSHETPCVMYINISLP